MNHPYHYNSKRVGVVCICIITFNFYIIPQAIISVIQGNSKAILS